MLLGHSEFRPLQAIQYQLTKERKADFAGNMLIMLSLTVCPIDMIRCVGAGNIAVFAQLDIPFRSHNDRSAVTP